MIKLAAIVGPTAVGKTAISIEVAKMLGAQIVSADSIQVYKGLDIGSAKPTAAEMQGVVHHMLSVVPVNSPLFSVAEYKKLAMGCIEDICAKGQLPLVVGGTGLYVNALTLPMGFAIESNHLLRERLRREHTSPEELHKKLAQVDQATAARLHPNDQKRVIRALEVYMLSGKPLSAHADDAKNQPPPCESVIIGLTMERGALYERIDARVDAMMREGLYDEAHTLYKAGYDATLPALQGLGYKQLFAHFAGECTLESAVDDIKRQTRRFAKRQLTWFRHDERVRWFELCAECPPPIMEIINAIQAGLAQAKER